MLKRWNRCSQSYVPPNPVAMHTPAIEISTPLPLYMVYVDSINPHINLSPYKHAHAQKKFIYTRSMHLSHIIIHAQERVCILIHTFMIYTGHTYVCGTRDTFKNIYI